MKWTWGLIFLISININGISQDDLLKIIDQEEQNQEQKVFTYATFKGTRLINGHTIETRGQNELEFIISHRFGEINRGSYDLWGLDYANIRFGLNYGLTGNLVVGIGRSSYQKTYDGYAKYRLLRQQSGKTNIPFSITVFSSVTIRKDRYQNTDRDTDQMAYTHQILIAKKFNSLFSLQIMPSYVHYNHISESQDNAKIMAIGIGMRVKLSKRIAINIEHYPTLQPLDPTKKTSLAIGFDIETGGHVFQLHFTNSQSMVEKGFIAETTDDFFNGDIRFGFNISRVFSFSTK